VDIAANELLKEGECGASIAKAQGKLDEILRCDRIDGFIFKFVIPTFLPIYDTTAIKPCLMWAFLANASIVIMAKRNIISLTNLPLEILLEICHRIDRLDLASFAVVSQQFNRLIEHNVLYHANQLGYALAYGVKTTNVAAIKKVIRFGGHIDHDLGEASIIRPDFTTVSVSSLRESGFLTVRTYNIRTV
jgi:hypothetical protein